MATCSPTTLLASGKGFQALADRELMICEAELLREWLGGSAPTVATLMSAGAEFQKLDSRSVSAAKAQMLCNIIGGI